MASQAQAELATRVSAVLVGGALVGWCVRAVVEDSSAAKREAEASRRRAEEAALAEAAAREQQQAAAPPVTEHPSRWKWLR